VTEEQQHDLMVSLYDKEATQKTGCIFVIKNYREKPDNKWAIKKGIQNLAGVFISHIYFLHLSYRG
jgi:hypothetical protein